MSGLTSGGSALALHDGKMSFEGWLTVETKRGEEEGGLCWFDGEPNKEKAWYQILSMRKEVDSEARDGKWPMVMVMVKNEERGGCAEGKVRRK